MVYRFRLSYTRLICCKKIKFSVRRPIKIRCKVLPWHLASSQLTGDLCRLDQSLRIVRSMVTWIKYGDLYKRGSIGFVRISVYLEDQPFY
jgi:hypothetical protein